MEYQVRQGLRNSATGDQVKHCEKPSTHFCSKEKDRVQKQIYLLVALN